MQRVIKCSKCKKNFIQKWVNRFQAWSQLNEVLYWTNGQKWNGYQHFCRSCLKKWFELDRENFDHLVRDETKQQTFFSYRGHGALDKPDQVTNTLKLTNG